VAFKRRKRSEEASRAQAQEHTRRQARARQPKASRGKTVRAGRLVSQRHSWLRPLAGTKRRSSNLRDGPPPAAPAIPRPRAFPPRVWCANPHRPGQCGAGGSGYGIASGLQRAAVARARRLASGGEHADVEVQCEERQSQAQRGSPTEGCPQRGSAQGAMGAPSGGSQAPARGGPALRQLARSASFWSKRGIRACLAVLSRCRASWGPAPVALIRCAACAPRSPLDTSRAHGTGPVARPHPGHVDWQRRPRRTLPLRRRRAARRPEAKPIAPARARGLSPSHHRPPRLCHPLGRAGSGVFSQEQQVLRENRTADTSPRGHVRATDRAQFLPEAGSRAKPPRGGCGQHRCCPGRQGGRLQQQPRSELNDLAPDHERAERAPQRPPRAY